MEFVRNPILDQLIAWRESERPEEREMFARMAHGAPRIALGYYEAELAEQSKNN